eukprot:gene8994-6316_t
MYFPPDDFLISLASTPFFAISLLVFDPISQPVHSYLVSIRMNT